VWKPFPANGLEASMKSFRLQFAAVCGAVFFLAAPRAGAVVLGDRAVLSINNTTYTQRQVEMYIVIKESLRKNTALESARIVHAGNWLEALTVFTEDMIIHQESLRLGGLQATDQLIDRFSNLIKEKNVKSPLFRATMDRLGADQVGVTRVLDTVIRVAAFRRSKDRQATSTGTPEIDDVDNSQPSWLSELKDRAIIRRYEGAQAFLEISPTGGSSGGGR
jgi:hypothetical protein